jgi:hypothetical protein
MLVDGKTFNGVTVTGIGFTKAIHIYFRAMTVYQTRTTNFTEHERALKKSCEDFVVAGQPLNGFNAGGVPVPGATMTAADCEQVANAAAAAELRRLRSVTARAISTPRIGNPVMMAGRASARAWWTPIGKSSLRRTMSGSLR